MSDWYDRLTSYIAYFMSGTGVLLSSMTLEQWYFLVSILIGVGALLANVWHKRAMQKIAREKGVFLNEVS
ncbi:MULTISPECIES: HP1 family phage holin [Vibrio]|uniref:HP1 family phage holin n=1 Tax=Vibrio TaxID=662 RepID=UPI000B8EE4BA|nr:MULTISPECIES: HP1 family phage holin [Vibrio]MBF4257527.1 hypothetical protein [Vibrio anguillarum]MBF4278124.1 hypothetical protein [Vibrio anguillarum]MBF4296832.1 hypothetical protein [Vibrio anguillarum]MBF4300542.1 hypothetical protein [Vibrio anguillarum]MBF4349059.1 hypothetical protein [Vibrio anguillarum]